ncbi:lipoprotein [Luteimicrobium album]|uniref:Lipoprotein n=1 Tax=Luteimicrobium album TaxID=1054550 RepID=A0ABQ6I5T7_9MICO|nr:DUF58 domain-containing protein [Luteimicrobium album]GMA25159.1 lipoprotein [Luteimicrobium album]
MILTWRAFALAGVLTVAVLVAPTAATVIVATAVLVLACVVDVALAASPRDAVLEREVVPAAVRLGGTARSVLTLRNGSPRALRGVVRDAWVPSAGAGDNRHPLALPPGEAVRLTTGLAPTRRGDRAAGAVTIRSLGPLRLAGRQASLPVRGRLRVLPEFASRKHLPSRLARLRELDGRATVQVRGEGTEFDSLREYVIGDDVRSIDWRATARRGDVVVRTWRPERDRRVVVVLDTSRTSAARVGDQPRLDAGIDAGLLLAALASHAGDRVDVLAYDRAVRARVRGASGTRLLPALAEALATVEPELVEADWPGLVGQVRSLVSQRALVVLVTTLDPAAVETGLLPVVGPLAARHQVLVASVADPELDALRADRDSSADVYDAAAAERVGLERAAVAGILRRRGADVVEAGPDELAPRVADAYLALKAAGRL